MGHRLTCHLLYCLQIVMSIGFSLVTSFLIYVKYTLIFKGWAASAIYNWTDALHCISFQKVWEINVVNQHGMNSANCSLCLHNFNKYQTV